jgi:5-deoxy-5-amino-3-dehydroquinate dehydratase
MTARLLLLNGPNLGILGRREPEIYGRPTLGDIEKAVTAQVELAGWVVTSIQDDYEGGLVQAVNANSDTIGAIINPGALMIAGWSLRDALAAYPRPWIEVHISNVWAREQFRHESVLAPLADGVVAGLGSYGYCLAAQALLNLVRGNQGQ